MAGCSSSPSTPASLQPPGATPNASTKMVCAAEEQRNIAVYLGERARVSKPSWVNDTYRCNYQYPEGTVRLAIKELGSWSSTKRYFNDSVRAAGPTTQVHNMGQQAAQAEDGTVFVRKDFSVLTVDVTGVPAQLGRPPTAAADVAYTFADLIMACWTGE